MMLGCCDIALDLPILQAGAINVVAIVPCPAVVRMNRALDDFIAENNASGAKPIYAPPILDGNPQAIETTMRSMQSEDDLPDILVTPALGTVFSRSFREKFFDTGIYQGINHPESFKHLPLEYHKAFLHYNIGFLAFGAWSVVWDLSFGTDMPCPTSWDDLANPAFKNQFAMQGFNGIASGIHLLALLHERLGEEGVISLGGNVKEVRHFSEIIKTLNSQHPMRAPFSILPNAATAQIPAFKKAAVLEFSEGQLIIPLMMFAKTSTLGESRKAIEFFWSDPCRKALAVADFYLPDEMDWSRTPIFPDFDRLAREDFAEFAPRLNRLFGQGRMAAAALG